MPAAPVLHTGWKNIFSVQDCPWQGPNIIQLVLFLSKLNALSQRIGTHPAEGSREPPLGLSVEQQQALDIYPYPYPGETIYNLVGMAR